MSEEPTYPESAAPSNYIEKVSLVTGEVLDDEVLPRQLLVHSHRDYHVVDVQARWLMSRLVGSVGDEDRVVQLMRGVRKAGLKTTKLLGRVIGEGASDAIAQRLVGLKEREYYFRYRKPQQTAEEIAEQIQRLQDAAAAAFEATKTGDGAAQLRVLLTGGTGFVGKEIIWQAARDPEVAELVVVVRPKTVRDRKTKEVIEVISPQQRGEQLLHQLWLHGESAAKVRFIAGDIEQPNLGISESDYEALTSTITHMIHSAASVSFDDPYGASYSANVEGARNALAFSYSLQTAENSPFVAHVGIETSYIHGRQTTQSAREDEVLFPRNFYNNYYELTKAMGSIETERFMLEEGLRVTQLCPAIVIGEARTGNNRGDTKVVNAPVNLFGRVGEVGTEGPWRERSTARVLAQMAATFPADPSAELNIIPVDWVVGGIVGALKNPRAVGERVHLATDNRLTSQQICDTVFEELEVEVRLAEPTMHRNVTLPATTTVLRNSGQDRVANALEKLGGIFGSYSEWGQPIHEVGNDQRLLGMPETRPNTLEAFRMLCRHNRWVQNFGRIYDLDEMSRREKVWVELIDELEAHAGMRAAQMNPTSFREVLHERIDVDTFTRRDESAPATTRAARERLGAADAAWLQMDRPDNRMIINAMMQFDEDITPEEMQGVIEERLLRFDRFRQRVVLAEGLETLPCWEHDPSFDIDNHLIVHTLDNADERSLNDLVDTLVAEGLDPAHPPWQLHLVRTPSGSKIIARLHHCIGDGASLVYVMLSLTDAVSPDAPDEDEPIAERSTLGRLASLVKNSPVILHDHIATLSDPRVQGELADAGLAGAAALGKLVLMPSDPPSVLRGELGVPKRTAWSGPISLDAVKAAKRALGATVNDVLMAALAGSLRRYLIARGDDPNVLGKIRAIVPVNLRSPDETPTLGNRFGLIFLDLPIGEDHELDRVDEIHRIMSEHKGGVGALVSLKALQGAGHLSEALEDRALRMFTSKATLVASNVPGPYEELHLAGKPIKSCVFWVPQSGDIGVGVSILSYAGQIRVGVIADTNLVPDPAVLVSAFEDEVAAICSGLSTAS